MIARRDHLELARTMSSAVDRGELVPILPGIYASARASGDPLVRMKAAMLWDPDAVLTGSAAAAVSFWPELRVPVIGVALRRRSRCTPRGLKLSWAQIPPELVDTRGGLRFTSPALTALDLCDSHDGDGIDTALRTRAATLEEMWRALELTPGRVGNARRRQLLLDSRDSPWSRAERLLHRLLRQAGITGWQGNLELRGRDTRYFVDVVFKREMIALEVDGRLHETDEDLFESDRWRQNFLVLEGWKVLRFTWRMLTEDPQSVIETVLAALAGRR